MLMAVLSTTEPDLSALLKEVSPDRLRATVEKLTSFQTRNTLSPMLTEAAEWLAAEYRSIPGVQVEIMRYTIAKSRRVPEDKEVVQVLAWLPGSESTVSNQSSTINGRAILAGGHFDSLNLQADVATGRAPGANDDASGTALALELARVMSRRKWPQTLVFCGFSGEEQGLNGSRALARRAKAEGWKIEAVLNNDMVGNSQNKLGQKDDRKVRVFSGEYVPQAAEGAAGPSARPPHNSRELARFIEWITRGKVKGFGIKLVFRQDRFGRGGDHTPFMEEGFSAVRFVEVHEEYTRQHTPDDLPKDMDWRYLANNTRMNLIAMASLAEAGPAPTNVRIDLRQGHDTTLTWATTPGTRYIVYWRDTASPTWQGFRDVGSVDKATIEKVNKDDHVFAVGAIGGLPVIAR
mgnify:CR=1 FL=1